MCSPITDLLHILPGWRCCTCGTYNGLQRQECRACRTRRHELQLPATVKQCACGFGYRPTMGEVMERCPVCKERIGLRVPVSPGRPS